MFNKEEIAKLNEKLNDLRKEIDEHVAIEDNDSRMMFHLISMYTGLQEQNDKLSREISELKSRLNQFYAKNNNANVINCNFSGNNNYVIITRKKVNEEYRYVKLPHFAFSDYPKSEFYQLKSATDATVFKNEHEANYFNPDPKLFEVVPRNY